VAARILIVEDEPDLLDLLDGGLRTAGFTVDLAAEGGAGLRLACANVPDLVLLDLMLPDMDGTEVCRRLRRDPATGKAGIIIVSAKSELLDRIGAFQDGADDYIVKPFSFRELLLRIQAVLRRTQGASMVPMPQRRRSL
jgi:two-component system, OmpR family, phosphate regulon response regulator PhoB